MTANPIGHYLLKLTSRKANQLFLIAALIGSVSIWFDIGVPWLPAVIVVIYGMLLFCAAKFYLVTHSDTTNNSPYFPRSPKHSIRLITLMLHCCFGSWEPHFSPRSSA